MSLNNKSSVQDINRHIRKYNLISLPATIIIGFGIYLLFTGKGAEFHPWLAEQAFVIKLMLAAGVIEVLAMSRVTKLNRLKQVVLNSHKLERRYGAFH
jgi:formate/nitrite transporter FocA (FNT family)